MFSNALEDILVRQIPQDLEGGHKSGEYVIYGSILKSIVTGRIVGHLQETGATGSLINGILSLPISAPFETVKLGIDVVGHVTSFVQNEQIKAAIAALRNFQLAGLALGAAGIGVSIVGFAIVSHKISRLETQVAAMSDKFDAIGRSVDALRRDLIAKDMDCLRTAAQRMDEGWQLSSPEAQWRDVASEMHRLQTSFSRRVEEIFERPGVADLAGAEPFLDALALASAVRVSARLAAGDETVARQAAQEAAVLLGRHGKRYRIAEAALADLRTNKVKAATQAWSEALDRSTEATKPLIKATRAREAAASSTVFALEELKEQEINGRQWMESARAETDAPFIFLPSCRVGPA